MSNEHMRQEVGKAEKSKQSTPRKIKIVLSPQKQTLSTNYIWPSRDDLDQTQTGGATSAKAEAW